MLIYDKEQKVLEVKNRSISGVKLHVFAGKDTGVVNGTIKPDYTKMLIALKLQRGDETIQFQDTLRNALVENSFMQAVYPVIFGAGIALTADQILFPVEIDFRKMLNLSAGDLLSVEITLLPGFFGGTAALPAKSHVDAEPIDGIGVEYVTPFIVTKHIPTGESRFALALGNNIESIAIVDTKNLTALNLADNAIQSVSLYSDKITSTDTFADLIVKRYSAFETAAEADKRGNTVLLYQNSNVDLDNCRIEVSLDPAKVTAQRYAVVYRHYTTNKGQINRGLALAAKHQRRNNAKLG